MEERAVIKSTDMFAAVRRDTQECGAKQVRHGLKSDKQFTIPKL